MNTNGSKDLSQIQNWVQSQENEMSQEFDARKNIDAKN